MLLLSCEEFILCVVFLGMMLEAVIKGFRTNKHASKGFSKEEYLRDKSVYHRIGHTFGSAAYLYFDPLVKTYQFLKKK